MEAQTPRLAKKLMRAHLRRGLEMRLKFGAMGGADAPDTQTNKTTRGLEITE